VKNNEDVLGGKDGKRIESLGGKDGKRIESAFESSKFRNSEFEI